MEAEFTLIGGILRFRMMSDVVSDQLQAEVNVPDDATTQSKLLGILGRKG